MYCVKWLLDFKSDANKITADYTKAISSDLKREAKLQIIPTIADKYLDAKSWQLVWESAYKYGYKWLYHKQIKGTNGIVQDTDLHIYLLLDANTEDIKLLYPKVCIQNGLLNKWQGRLAIHDPEHLHFLQPLISYVPSEDWETNKSLHYLGGWKFSLRSSEKTLKLHTENVFEYFKKYSVEVLSEYEKPLFDNLKMTPEEAKTYLEKHMQKHRFFQNYLELYLVYAIHYFENGNLKEANELAEQVKTRANQTKHPIAKEWIISAQSILDGKPKLNELLSLERSYF